MAERETVDVAGRRIAYRRLGSGPPLLIVNGFAASADDWDPGFLEALAAGHELILPDNRGTGATPGKPGEITVGAMAADVAGLSSALGLERPTLLGWSMGGYICLSAALAEPGLAGRLVLLATDGGGPDRVPPNAEAWERLIDLSGTPREQATRLINLLFAPAAAAAVDRDFGEIVAAARAALDPAVLGSQVAVLEAWTREGVAQRLGEITVPTLIAAGTDDVVIPAANSLALAEGIDASWLARFRGVGHGFMAEVPAPLAALVGDFMAAG